MVGLKICEDEYFDEKISLMNKMKENMITFTKKRTAFEIEKKIELDKLSHKKVEFEKQKNEMTKKMEDEKKTIDAAKKELRKIMEKIEI